MTSPVGCNARALFARSLPLLVAGLACLPWPSHAQGGSGAPDTTRTLRLFLDCSAVGCDVDFLRTNLTWVDYVRERLLADVHVIATSLSTGSGGSEVRLHFTGLLRFASMDDTLRYINAQGATLAEQRAELLRMLKLGLARYAARIEGMPRLDVGMANGPTAAPTRTVVRDRWNLWVFTVSASGSAGGESRSASQNLGMNFSAARIAETWKVQLYLASNTTASNYTLADGSRFEASTRSTSGVGALVRALGPRFSSGVHYSGSSSTPNNIDLHIRVALAAEFDAFPYAEFTRRRLLLSYSVGVNVLDYAQLTVYDKRSENLVDHRASLGFALRQPWGVTDVGISASAYIPDHDKNRVSVFASASVRVTRGLQVYGSASYSRVRDQVSLAKGDATDEEVLLQLRQLQTNYRYSANVGFSFTFGSVFNNVVNPRMSL